MSVAATRSIHASSSISVTWASQSPCASSVVPPADTHASVKAQAAPSAPSGAPLLPRGTAASKPRARWTSAAAATALQRSRNEGQSRTRTTTSARRLCHPALNSRRRAPVFTSLANCSPASVRQFSLVCGISTL